MKFARVGYFKPGVNLKTENVMATQLEKGVQKVQNSPAYEQNIKALARVFAAYNPDKLYAVYR